VVNPDWDSFSGKNNLFFFAGMNYYSTFASLIKKTADMTNNILHSIILIVVVVALLCIGG
jgi:exoribonuclease II